MSKQADVARPNNSKHLTPSDLPFPVVGIGASAGGIQALLRFFEALPADCGMAFVVVMHLSPEHQSSLDQILQRATRLPVQQVTQPVPIEADHVYVIPPGFDLTMNDGYLRLNPAERLSGDHVAVDLFFRALADVHKTRAIAIVLSGNGADGSVGLGRIKEQGGVTLAQAPEDAEFDSMPSSAIAAGAVDFVMPVVDMPQKLLELATTIHSLSQGELRQIDFEARVPGASNKAMQLALRDILTLLRTRTGHNFKQYKTATVLRRVERRMQVNTIPDMPAYACFLHEHPEETPALLKDMLIGVTNFFRDREAFEALERDIIPELFEQVQGLEEDQELRVWSAACSSGEEAYSLAMLLTEQAELRQSAARLQIFATDLDEHALAVARHGVYPGSIVTDVPPSRLRQHLLKEQNQYRVKKELREKVLFAQHNLLSDPPFSRLDLISCRNLLIYLDREVQAEILHTFHFALKPGGYLFLGSSESADVQSNLFATVDKKNRIYRAKHTTSVIRPTPLLNLNPGIHSVRLPPHQVGRRKKVSFAEVHQRVLEQYAPPSIIVDRESNIVHLSERAGRFLRYVGGEPSYNLPALVLEELRLELRTALFQALQSNKSVEARRVHIQRDDRSYYINMVVRPFRDSDTSTDYMLVLFDEVEDVMSTDSTNDHTEAKDSVLTQLEAELQRTKEQLQLTIEQSETSTEELKASNEELQAINEELRSATEELETSKEELQSINEELITVNYELKAKIEETGKINDDLQNLITSTDIATVFVDRGMRIKRFTPRAASIFNIIVSDTGRSLLDITHRLDYPELASDANQVFESLGLIEREVRSHDDRWYLARLLPYRTAEDRIEGAVLTFIDITERRLAQDRARAGEENMRLVAQNIQDYAIVTLDASGVINSWNGGATKLFGYSEREALGQPLDLIFTPEDIASQVPETELRTADAQGVSHNERWLRRKDGSRLYCAGVLSRMNNASGGQGYAKIARDATADHVRTSEAANQQAQQRALVQLKDEFFAVMSHELKHPLNLIQLNSELLARSPVLRDVALARRATEAIQRAVRSQAQIIDDLLDLSRIRTGKLKLERQSLDLAQQLHEIAAVVRPLAGEVQVHCTRLPETPLYVQADATRIGQIVWNLLNNAIKFTPAGGQVEITLGVEGEEARLDVSDTGQGIAPDFLPRVFEMFGQAEMKYTARAQHGLGIGLALVKQLVEAHGGRIEAHSTGLGQGARFSVWLPLCHAEQQLAPTVQADEQSLAGLRALLVDDSADIVETLQLLLEEEGVVVTAATDSHNGLALAQAQDFDVILSDIGMPEMDGHEFLRRVRAGDRNVGTPAVALSGYGTRLDVDKARAAGFVQHLNKPVSFEALLAVLRELRASV
ncbi:chemotaxis protein [Pseudomonas oryzihabitans]|nr:chemotaxis protein [Pseudomonas psychrotolerans]KTT04232.1 chemotaxis protein [Pseudomonas psychrotolerans]KTT20572.1 chemotaxis protein [Pseudomonas psychrotolerans]KTT39505.1 chemotaxis protein [Pseudomonas psychrotolerans]KTT46457.1 chemotaxis protein [Pseudomonas psychrotolerans]